jgi:hypothetical protein
MAIRPAPAALNASLPRSMNSVPIRGTVVLYKAAHLDPFYGSPLAEGGVRSGG